MFKNSQNTYGAVSKLFHWTIALMMMGMLLLGFFMEDLPSMFNKGDFMRFHKSTGMLILWLVAARILWNVWTKKPKSLSTHAKWEKLLSKITHFFLYIAMLGMPLSGWFMSTTSGRPVSMFGLKMPTLLEKNEALNSIFGTTHHYLAYALVAGILLHALGAFKHHFMDKDSTLNRMVFPPKPLFAFVALAVFIFFVGALIRLLIF